MALGSLRIVMYIVFLGIKRWSSALLKRMWLVMILGGSVCGWT